MSTPPRVFIYGFGPYRQFRANITARIIRSLPRDPLLKRKIFPVRFHRRQFVGALERIRPDMILGLGQSARRRIEVETRAANRRRARAADAPKPIAANGPAWIKTTWLPKLGRGAGPSQNAGDYVCNFSMYVMLDHLRRRKLETPYAFVHIPHDCEWQKAAAAVARILRGVRARHRTRRAQRK